MFITTVTSCSVACLTTTTLFSFNFACHYPANKYIIKVSNRNTSEKSIIQKVEKGVQS